MPLHLLMHVASLLVDSDRHLQEQAFHIVRHVAGGVEDVELKMWYYRYAPQTVRWAQCI